MSEPALSVVVASVNGFPYLEATLDSLERHCPDAEIIVADCTDDETRDRVRRRWPDVKLLAFREPTTVPQLRAAGIGAAAAPHVAVIEDHCVVANGWARRLVEGHRRGFAAVGGPVRNGATRRIRDWAGFLFEYGAYAEPMPPGPARSLTGMNVSYDRRAIAAVADLLDDGRWENWLHSRLHERGLGLYLEPEAVLEHVKDFGVREFVAQRYHYSRAYAGMRNAELGARRLGYALASPALVPLLAWRIAANVIRRGRHRRELALASPLILLYVLVSAAGEAVGYAFGGGRSLLRVK